MAFLVPLPALAQTSKSRVVLSVPFAVQAPFGDWSQPWQDFCEEASVVMVAHFVWQLPLVPGMAELEMQIIQQYENVVFRRNRDTSAEETASILRKLYGLKNISVQSVGSTAGIKREIQNGKPVIVPAAGQMLENPYFKAPGPLYHMLVITGFDDAKNIFITNEPGTRRGESFAYDQQNCSTQSTTGTTATCSMERKK